MNKYKKNVSAANKYIGRFDCLNAYKDTWGVKSVTAITTDKFEILPQLSVMGYFENTYDKNGNLVSSDGKLAADAKWSGSISWQVITPIGPLYLNLSGSGKLSGKLGTEYDYKNKKLKIADGNLKFIPSVTIEGGYGIDKVATVGAQGTLSVPITIVPTSKGEFEAKAALHVKLVFVIDYTHDLVDYKETIWDTTSKIKNIRKGNIIQISEEKFSEMDVSFDEASGKWNGGKINKQLRKLSKRISDAIVNNTITLQKGILPSSLPMQLQINNKNVMVFQAYDNSRTTLNSTVLKYSIFENGFWSEPKAVLDDGYADMFSDMKVINNKLVLVWQKVCKEIRGDVENDSKSVLKDIARNSEIYFSVFDEDTNTFVNPVKVTKNSQYDMMPHICSDSNDIIVSWVRNDAADLMQETGKNTIYTAKWNGSSFEEEVSLSQATGTIDEYVVYQNGESIQSVFVGQTSGIISVYGTDGHILTALSKLIFASYDGKISSLNYSDGQISCIANGKLYSYDIYSENVASGMAGNSAFASEVKYCSNGEKSGYIWSTYDEETDMGSIIASMKTETGYSEPITICKKEHVMWRYFYPIIDLEGNWQIVANALDTQTDLNLLLYVTKESRNNLELVDAYVNENDVLNGLTGVNYFVTNTEDNVINNIEVVITLKDGSRITKTIQETILPGESKAGTVYMDLQDVISTQNVTLSLYAENQTDISDNVVNDQIGCSDISVDAVSSETPDEVYITATLKNMSSVDANATLYLYGNEKMTTQLQKRDGITLNASENMQVKFIVNKNDITYNENNAAYLTLYVSEEDDYNEDNNIAYIMLYFSGNPQKTTGPIEIPAIESTAKPTQASDQNQKPTGTLTLPLGDAVTNLSDSNSNSILFLNNKNTVVQPMKIAKIVYVKNTKKGCVVIKWNKTEDVGGCQIQYSINRRFKMSRSKNVKKTKYTIRKLKRNKIYHIRLRTYRIVNGARIYSKWSKVKKIKIKK